MKARIMEAQKSPKLGGKDKSAIIYIIIALFHDYKRQQINRQA